MNRHSRCFALPVPSLAPRVLFLLLTVAALPAWAHATTLIWLSGRYTLQQDEAYSSVIIGPTAEVCTGGHILSITGNGGLMCLSLAGNGGDLLINGASGRVVLSGGGSQFVGDGGTIVLAHQSACLEITASTTISGGGQILGQDESATISVASRVMLTSDVAVAGKMTIEGPGTFKNTESITATTGTIELASDLSLSDQSSGDLWAADGTEGGELVFRHAQTGNEKLNGRIKVDDCGTLSFEASIRTGGELALGEGIIVLAAQVSVAYATYASTVCENPGTGTSPNLIMGPFSRLLIYICGVCDPPQSQ